MKLPVNRIAWASAISGLVAYVGLCSSPARAGDVSLPPSMTLAGPYGNPFALLPAAHFGMRSLMQDGGVASGSLPGRGADSLPGRRVGPRSITKNGAADDDDEDDDEAPRKPGTLGQDFLKVPAAVPPLRRTKSSLGPHLAPDREFEITERTSMGVFGQADRLEARVPGVGPARSIPVTTPSIRARDVGAGLGLQFKLGQ